MLSPDGDAVKQCTVYVKMGICLCKKHPKAQSLISKIFYMSAVRWMES